MTTCRETSVETSDKGAPGAGLGNALSAKFAGLSGQASREASDWHRSSLARVVETEILPRLLLIQRSASRLKVAPPAASTLDSDDVAAFAGLVLADDVSLASSFLEELRARGASVEALYLDLFAPTARLLGEFWDDDLCNFLTVSLGLCRLQQMLQKLSPAFLLEARPQEHSLRALLVPFPGEQHSLGVFIVTEFFRRAGWDVSTGPVASPSDLIGIVRDNWFAILGISVSRTNQLEALTVAIRAIRRASRNPDIGVLVGGSAFIDQPDLAARIGADSTAIDARMAALWAENLLTLKPKAVRSGES